jgi:hypothetical protein
MNTKTKAVLAFTMIFLIGFATGFLFNNAVSGPDETITEERSERGERLQQRGGNGDRRDWEQRVQRRLTDELDLTESQKDPLFEKVREYHTEIRDLIHDRREDEHEMILHRYSAFRDEVSSLLDPRQLEKMDNHFHPDTVRAKMEGRQGQRRERN